MARVLVLSNASLYGGAEVSLETLTPYLLSGEHQYQFIVHHPQHKENLIAQGVLLQDIIVFKKWRKGIPWNLFLFIRSLWTFKPNCIFSNSREGSLYIYLLSLFYPLRRYKIVVYIRDFTCPSYVLRKLKQAIFLIPSQAVQEKREYSKWLSSSRTFILPDPICMPSENIYSEKKQCLLYPTSFIPWKGLEYALYAFSKLEKADMKLIFIGKKVDSAYYHKIKVIIQKLGLEQRVEIHSFANNLEEYYRQALCVINTSISEQGGPETFGRTLIEAWSHKKPVIAFDCGGPKYIVEDEKNGLLVPEKDIDALAKAIETLLSSPKLRTYMGQYGFESVLKNYDATSIAPQLEAFFESAVTEN
jgi:glycosyltransferase involved in cell wall biosynthesis